jgi:alpha-tubulin suppressor-like RCC1 family protein
MRHSNVPIALNDLSFTNIIDIRAGSFSAALSSENQFYVWGKGTFGDFFNPCRVKSFNELNIRDFQISRTGSSFVLT